MKKQDLKDISIQELTQMINEDKQNMVKFKINHKVSDLENPKIITKTRKHIAQLKTELRRRELEQVTK